jgi:hypothetical protein
MDENSIQYFQNIINELEKINSINEQKEKLVSQIITHVEANNFDKAHIVFLKLKEKEWNTHDTSGQIIEIMIRDDSLNALKFGFENGWFNQFNFKKDLNKKAQRHVLYVAFSYNRANIAKYLIEKGASVHSPIFENSPNKLSKIYNSNELIGDVFFSELVELEKTIKEKIKFDKKIKTSKKTSSKKLKI